jgi:hypothetical protein
MTGRIGFPGWAETSFFDMHLSSSFLKRRYSDFVALARDLSPDGRATLRRRAMVEDRQNSISDGATSLFGGVTLIDGNFDNPNFWFRYALLRSALGLANGHEIGAIGPYRRKHVRSSFARMGISNIVDLTARPRRIQSTRATVNFLLASTKTPDDVLAWALPGNVDPVIIYDSILKRQRSAAVDLNHPEMHALISEAIERIERAAEVLEETNPDLVVMSHTIGMVCGPLAYLAAARGIPVVLIFGLFGVLRFARFANTSQLFSFYDRPTRPEIDSLPKPRADAMANIGRAYLSRRFRGKADDLASVYAFQKSKGIIDRVSLCARFGWDPEKPIVAFYASNWFDWPHQLGMTQFRDFLDWTEATFEVARKSSQFNWLFKPHPAEDWFGGIALADIMKRMGSAPHIAVSDKSWNNTCVLNSIDALVTYHSTAGVEFASMGKPVLVPDRGKYDDCGFVLVASSRAEYLSLLAQPWWHKLNRDDVRRRAEIFAGWWFCMPAWQKGFVLADDSRQDELYEINLNLLENNSAEVAREIKTLRDWWASSHRYYHTWKMAESNSFQLSNV